MILIISFVGTTIVFIHISLIMKSIVIVMPTYIIGTIMEIYQSLSETLKKQSMENTFQIETFALIIQEKMWQLFIFILIMTSLTK